MELHDIFSYFLYRIDTRNLPLNSLEEVNHVNRPGQNRSKYQMKQLNCGPCHRTHFRSNILLVWGDIHADC